MTRTYAELEVSPRTYAEIRTKLVKAGYTDALHADDRAELIDMHGIALKRGQRLRRELVVGPTGASSAEDEEEEDA